MFSKKQIDVGGVLIGGDAPISIQTMTNTNTEDIEATISQINTATEAGADLIRVSCPTPQSTIALREIINHSKIPIIADIHFNYKRAIEAMEAGASCVRINPGNMAMNRIIEVAACAKLNNCAIRIGVNSGSLERELLDKYGEPGVEALVESALAHIQQFENLGCYNLKVSVKTSDVQTTIDAYRRIFTQMEYPLHLGVTEAGPVFSGTIKSSIGIGALLCDGIGDTIRVSLSTSDIVEEIKVAQQILKSLHLLNNSLDVISCPTCARTLINVPKIAAEIDNLEIKPTKNITISILGCVVNGPGEARSADIGIFGFKKGIAKIYLRGEEITSCAEHDVIPHIMKLIATIK